MTLRSRLHDRRRRSERGAVMPIVALVVTTLMIATAFGVDHGRITTNRRNLQKIADLAALDAVREVDGGTTAELRPEVESAVALSAFRNEFVEDANTVTFANGISHLGGDKTIEYVMGRYDTGAQTFTATADDEIPNSVRVFMTEGFDYAFQPGGKVSTMKATAMAILPPDLCTDPTVACPNPPPCDPATDPNCPPTTVPFSAATFSLGSFVATFEVDTSELDAVERQARKQKNLLLNAVLGELLGDDTKALTGPTNPPQIPDAQLAIDVAGYQGLAKTWVTLDELRAVLGFGSVRELLEAEVDLPDFINGLSDALQLPDAPGLPSFNDDRIDGALAEIIANAPSGADVTPFEDPYITGARATDSTLTALAVSSLGEMGTIALDGTGKTVPVYDIIQVDAALGLENTVADAELNVLQLVASAAFINGDNLNATELYMPVTSPDASDIDATFQSLGISHPGLGIPAGGGLISLLDRKLNLIRNNLTRSQLDPVYSEIETTFPPESELLYGELQFSVIEPPVIVVGPPGMENGNYITSAETSQINAALELQIPMADLEDILVPGGILPGELTQDVADISLPLVVEGGRGFAGLDAIDCDIEAGTPSTFDVETTTLQVSAGQPVDLSAVDVAVQDAVVMTTDLDPTGLLGGLITLDITGLGEVTVAGESAQDLVVTAPYNIDNRTRIASDPTSDLGTSTLNNLGLTLSGVSVSSPGVIKNGVKNEIDRRIDKLERQVIAPLKSVLGAGIGGADLTVSKIDCWQTVLVED